MYCIIPILFCKGMKIKNGASMMPTPRWIKIWLTTNKPPGAKEQVQPSFCVLGSFTTVEAVIEISLCIGGSICQHTPQLPPFCIVCVRVFRPHEFLPSINGILTFKAEYLYGGIREHLHKTFLVKDLAELLSFLCWESKCRRFYDSQICLFDLFKDRRHIPHTARQNDSERPFLFHKTYLFLFT